MKKIIILSIIFLNSFNLSAFSKNDLYEKIDLFGEVMENIKKDYVDEVDQAEMIDAAINGVLQSLDPYSAYMSPELFKEMQSDTSGQFGGLGIEIGMEAGVVKVISPIDDTPAAKAGIKAGDYIVKIGKEQVQGKSLMEAVKLMRGPVGTFINLTVRRKNVKKPLEFKITRKIIEVKSVSSELISKDKNIGYIRLKSFNENSDKQFLKALKKFEKNLNIKGYVLDLRNNPGGLLTQAINITDFFLNDGEIVSTKGRNITETRKFFARNGDETNGKPIIVLINNGSASASEIFAGALKDHKRAIILGENSYGKGSVQSIIPLGNGGGIRLTISKYYLPSGKSISEVGVTPDILVEETSIKNIKIIREIKQMYEYELPKNLIGIIWKGKFRGQKQKWFIVRFTGSENEINLNTKCPEFIKWKWIDTEMLPNVIVKFKKDLYLSLLKEIKLVIS